MPKNKGKGGKKHKRGKHTDETKRELTLKEEGQEYGQVTRVLGNLRVEVRCFDNKTRLGKIRGTMRKKQWVGMGDIILLGLRDFEDAKCDVIMKYDADEARKLKQLGELPDEATINAMNNIGPPEDDNMPFDFATI